MSRIGESIQKKSGTVDARKRGLEWDGEWQPVGKGFLLR